MRGDVNPSVNARDPPTRRPSVRATGANHTYAEAGKPYFDFGTSTEPSDQTLNVGLLRNKESYGGRAVLHDEYTLEL